MRRSRGYIANGKYVRTSNIDDKVKQGEEHSQHRDHVRKDMAREYARDLIQPYTDEFVEAYPDKAKALGMVPEGEL